MIASGIAAVFIASGAAAAAQAVTAYPKEGGVWNYGLAGIYASSKYQHPTQAHKSSVRVADRYNSSICFRAGKESDAALTYWAWESRQFYYSASC